MKNYRIWQSCKSVLQHDKAILFLVVDHKGSSPGKTGFKMLITQDDQNGTIGGGIMEYNQIKNARELLFQIAQDSEFGVEKHKIINQVHHNNVNEEDQSGLICAGSQTLLRIILHKDDIATIEKIIESYRQNQARILQITKTEFQLLEEKPVDNSQYSFSSQDVSWEYKERIGQLNRAYIFGGGHVGLSISRVLSTLDFYIIINDNRENLSYLENNQYVQEKRVGKLEGLTEDIIEGDKTYVIVTNYGYKQDFEVLANILSKNLRYIGLMGSKAKINRIFNELQDKGYSKEEIEKIQAPIGIDIPNETAEEIAISVSAELIRIKNTPTDDHGI